MDSMSRHEIRHMMNEVLEEYFRPWQHCPTCNAETTFVKVEQYDADGNVKKGGRCLWCNTLYELKLEKVRL